MKYLSICSGIETAGVAWYPLGFECLGLSEIDAFRSAVLQYHYPEVKNYGDFTKIRQNNLPEKPDVIVGGTPCATFSIAGLRDGLESGRGNLALEFIILVQKIRPKWVLWENVPGVLSSNRGRDFGTFLGALAECGYGFAYRVLDTQYVRTQSFPRAIPQMRRRVFVVGCLGDWRSAASVLFDRSIMSWDSPPRRKSLQEKGDFNSEKITFRSTRSDKRVQDDVASTIAARDYKSATDLVMMRSGQTGANGKPWKCGASYTLTANDRYTLLDMRLKRTNKLRRLTAIECERLQGLPDNYTKIPYNNKTADYCPVGKRIEACGRGMSVNVMEFLGMQLQRVENNGV